MKVILSREEVVDAIKSHIGGKFNYEEIENATFWFYGEYTGKLANVKEVVIEINRN